MSEDHPKITTVKKEKDPRRVEAGKRLASISKAARERKMREKILAESKQNDNIESSDINYGYLYSELLERSPQLGLCITREGRTLGRQKG